MICFETNEVEVEEDELNNHLTNLDSHIDDSGLDEDKLNELEADV